jgi:hypothetical protein
MSRLAVGFLTKIWTGMFACHHLMSSGPKWSQIGQRGSVTCRTGQHFVIEPRPTLWSSAENSTCPASITNGPSRLDMACRVLCQEHQCTSNCRNKHMFGYHYVMTDYATDVLCPALCCIAYCILSAWPSRFLHPLWLCSGPIHVSGIR